MTRLRSTRKSATAGRAHLILAAVEELLEANGCDCECDHDSESHDDTCERCLACRIADVMVAATLVHVEPD